MTVYTGGARTSELQMGKLRQVVKYSLITVPGQKRM